MFFGLDAEDVRPALNDWQKTFGFTSFRKINLFDNKDVNNTLRYIAKYCNKGDFENPNVNRGNVYPTFHIVSKGLGDCYISKFKAFHLKGLKKYFNGRYYDFTDASMELVMSRFYVQIGDFKYKLPRYYVQKIFGEKTLLSSKISDFLFKRNDDVCTQQLSKLQAENPSDSPYRLLDLHNRREIALKTETLKKQNARFYNKSKI